jgi:hypothetical protein
LNAYVVVAAAAAAAAWSAPSSKYELTARQVNFDVLLLRLKLVIAAG